MGGASVPSANTTHTCIGLMQRHHQRLSSEEEDEINNVDERMTPNPMSSDEEDETVRPSGHVHEEQIHAHIAMDIDESIHGPTPSGSNVVSSSRTVGNKRRAPPSPDAPISPSRTRNAKKRKPGSK